jgi:long-chain acyl-CoA synthetase
VANFSSRIAAMAAASPDLVAIDVLGAGDAVRQTTYRELDAVAGRIAAWLQGAGVSRGDRAAILADNDAAWVAAYLGTLRLGAVAVPLDTGYKAPQVRTVLDDSGARVIFTTERYLDTARKAADGAGSGPATTLVLLSGRSPGIVDVPSLEVNGAVPPIVDLDGGAAAVILYTSGTTADPKGVVLTHANLDAEREAALAIIPIGPPDAILGVLPLFHALAQMANLLLPLSMGARVVFLETVSSSSLLSALASRGITVFACVPQFFYLIHQRVMAETAKKGRLVRGLVRSVIAANVWLRDRLGWNPGRLFFGSLHRRVGPKMRVLITGGSKFDAAIGRDLYGMGFTILNAYGLTETSGGATMQRPGDRFTTSVGQPFGGVELKIASHAEITPDVIADGEILIRGPIIMQGYFNRPDATDAALKDGWLYTGDLGRLDDKGRLYITGRKKEIIVLASGKNLYPEEIEAHYRQSTFIKELCILGVSRPGEPSAERLHALVVPDEQVLRERGIVNVGELVRFELESLAVQLPAYKRILSYDVTLEPLPRTTTGKIKRREVEQLVLDRAGKGESESRETTETERAWLAAPGRTDAMALIATRLGRERVRPDDNLELDLALDSMERVELLTVLEERQGTRVTPDVRATIFSVRQLLEAVEAAPPAGAGDEPGGGAELPWATLLASDTDPKLAQDLSRRRPVFEMALFVGFKIAGLLARALLRFRVRGVEHLPASGPMLLCPNHQTRWDGLFLGAALPFHAMRQLFVVAAAEYFETPFMRGAARMFNIVPIDPDANLVTAMQAGASGLRLGKALMLFPEGERTIDGDVKKFRKGAAILSAHLDAPIVPIAVDGLFDLWPRGRPSNWAGLLPWRARPVTLVFGPPIRVRAGEYTEGTAQLRAAVVAMLDDIREKSRSTLGERQST